MTGLAIGSIKARDEISEVGVIVIAIKMLMFRLSVMNFLPCRVANTGSKRAPHCCCCSSSCSGEDKTFMTRLSDTFVLVIWWSRFQKILGQNLILYEKPKIETANQKSCSVHLSLALYRCAFGNCAISCPHHLHALEFRSFQHVANDVMYAYWKLAAFLLYPEAALRACNPKLCVSHLLGCVPIPISLESIRPSKPNKTVDKGWLAWQAIASLLVVEHPWVNFLSEFLFTADGIGWDYGVTVILIA